MSVPLFLNEAGLPVGTMFTARFGAEAIFSGSRASSKSPAPG